MYTASEESGAEDSDEDIITDYLSPLDDNGNVDAATVLGGGVGNPPTAAAAAAKMACDGGAAAAAAAEGGAAPSIPSISITQHSPAASKAFYILGRWPS